MDIDTPTLEEVIESGNIIASEVSHHPAIVLEEMKKKEKTDQDELMEVCHGNQLQQIELASKLVSEIDDQIRPMFRAIRSKYSQRFPELKVAQPMQYIITAQLLGNRPDRVKNEDVKEQLAEFLEPKMHLLVTMSAATTQGIKIEPDEMELIMRACSVAIYLASLKAKLLAFVEKNMTTIAPNLSVILGAHIAAKLMGLAGSLHKLATMPSCNIAILGSHKMSHIESDISAPPPRVGHIYECDLIQQIPFDHTKDVRKRAVKWVANKCVLAARCDVSQSYPSGEMGREFRDQIETMINKELEPPPKKAARPLPAPIEKSGKKRGGKRVRRMKERSVMTELRKQSNRIDFKAVVDDDNDESYFGDGKSQLNANKKLRGLQINEKTKVRLSKGTQEKLAKQNQATRAADNQTGQLDKPSTSSAQPSTSSGTGISLNTDQQQLSIFNPHAKESSTQDSTSGCMFDYFSNSSGFFAIKREDKQ